ncbi:uncharacterized protein [Dendropsophus ebraccatus]|uniref:uncharacterized protein n=1 Tax=Dendropsophus ebraccatus TaxID=150705 RepID=UPI0038311188
MSDQESSSIVLGQSDDDSTDLYNMSGLLDGVNDSEALSVEDDSCDEHPPVSHQPTEEKMEEHSTEKKNYPKENPYEQQYYMQHMHLSSVLERGLTAIHSELSLLSRSVLQLVYGIKECADTMGFYTTRMLAFQQEMLNATSKANASLQTGVYLLRQINARHSPCIIDTYRANNQEGKPGQSDESRSKRHYRDVRPRSPEDNDSRYSKRDRKK